VERPPTKQVLSKWGFRREMAHVSAYLAPTFGTASRDNMPGPTRTCLARPAIAQDARACVNEVDRLSASFSIEGGNDNAIAHRPSARQGASLQPEQHKQISEILQEARAAGDNGDGQACAQGLGRARTALRQAGIGSAQPGAPAGTGLSPGSSGGSSTGRAGMSTVPGSDGSGRTGAGGADGAGPSGPAGSAAGSTGGGASGSGATGGTTGGGMGAERAVAQAAAVGNQRMATNRSPRGEGTCGLEWHSRR
jgi:hypothetical protein